MNWYLGHTGSGRVGRATSTRSPQSSSNAQIVDVRLRRDASIAPYRGAVQTEPYPVRKKLNHTTPFRVNEAFYFVTICAARRGGAEFIAHADEIVEAARFRHLNGKWFLALFLVMPDHLHMLVHVPPPTTLTAVISDFKRYLSTTFGLSFQAGYFDTRIRDAAHYAEKWNYIVRNPVVRGLSATPREWPHSIAYDRETGEERPHR